MPTYAISDATNIVVQVEKTRSIVPGSKLAEKNAIDQLYPRALCSRKAVSTAKDGVPAFRLGAAAITLIFSLLGFLVSRLRLC
jgi:hypothetical protein